MIVVEGPDGGGKTTLAKLIASELAMEYRRPPVELLSSSEGPSGKGLYDWWMDQFRLSRIERNVGVYDRCMAISEPIYQMAQVQRDLILTDVEIWRLVHDLWAEGPILIFCIPPMDVQYSNVIQDGRDSLAGLTNRHLEKISFMYQAFAAMWSEMLEETLVYDYTSHECDDTIDFVRRNLG